MLYWYILFTKTGNESKVEKLLKDEWDSDLFVPFTPYIETIYKKAGNIKKELNIMFPSYVFIESKLSSDEFVKNTYEILSRKKDIIKLLRYGDSGEVAMRDEERAAMLQLCNEDYCIESSSGFIKGDKVYITDGVLIGKESIIKKINRHKREAIIELEILGDLRNVIVGLEIVKKV